MQLQKLILSCMVILSVVEMSFSQGKWTPKANLPAPGRWAPVGFSIGTKGYLGTGMNMSGSFLNDFWEYNPIANSWTQKANFLGGRRAAAVGFSIGNCGYIGTGWDGGNVLYNDLWRYNPTLNSWIQVADVGGGPRYRSVGFSAAGKGYIGTGINRNTDLLQDLWEYDTVSNIWTAKANYAGGNRVDIDRAVFIINNKAYMGTGEGSGSIYYNDFWEYDPITNTWMQRANFPGTPRTGATGFSICNGGFLGLGKDNANIYNSDFWKYDPFTNSWSAVTAFPGVARYDQPAFVINNKAYVGTGISKNAFTFNDLWEFTLAKATIFGSSNSICSGQSATLSASGGSSYSWNNGSTNNPIVVSPTATTTYSVIVSDTAACGSSDMAAVTISVTTITAVIACQNNICAGSNTTLLASGGTNYIWSNGAVTSAITVSPAANTSYSVIASAGGCTDTANCTVNVFPVPVVTPDGITDVSCNGGNDGSATIMVNGGTYPYIYNWSPSGGTNAGATGLNAGTYLVTITDDNGCKQVHTITIAEPALMFLVPNAFSPNNDGENDEFCLQGEIENCIKELKIFIFGRWGEKVYESNDKNFCWDGSDNLNIFKGPLGTDVFVYYLKATLTNGKKISKKGNISLFR